VRHIQRIERKAAHPGALVVACEAVLLQDGAGPGSAVAALAAGACAGTALFACGAAPLTCTSEAVATTKHRIPMTGARRRVIC
jgi:hypothetical protein